MFTRYNSLLWQKPKALDEFDTDRKVTWLELFYDLIYVAVVSNMVHHLWAHFTLESLWIFILVFIPVFLSWINGTYYHDFHGREDIRSRVVTLLHMITIWAMAVTVNKAFEWQLLWFTIAYMVHHFVTILLWYRVWHHNKNQRSIVRYYITGYLLSIIVLGISLFFSWYTTIFLWILAVALSFWTPLFARKEHDKLVKINPYFSSISPSVMERFGLFTILILWESIAWVIAGLSTFHVMNPYYFWWVLIFGITISFSMWWLYFDLVRWKTVKKGSCFWIAWNYFHLPLFVSVGLIGASIQYIVGHGWSHVWDLVAWSLAVAVSVVILSLWAISYILKINETFSKARKRVNSALFIIAVIVSLIPFTAHYVDAVVYLGLIFFALVISLFFRIKVFVALELPEWKKKLGKW